MKSASSKQAIVKYIVMGLAVILQTLLVFYLQHRFAFLLEDMDYMVNLKTGKELTGIGDIIAGIPSVLGGKGGSVLSISLLQIILLLGENFADVLNTAVLMIISLLVAVQVRAGKRDLVFFALPFFMLISLNSDWQYSYMWQFGIVNFVYPAIPFLIFLIMVSKELNRGKNSLPKWMHIVGCLTAFLAGWANASYGLVEICMSVTALLIITKLMRRRYPMWLAVSTGCSAIGTILYLAASGNFKEGSIVNGIFISFSIFPGVVLALLLLAIILRSGGFLKVEQMLMIVALGFSVIMRFVIGWIPGIAENGIQICCLILSIVLFCSLLSTLKREYPKHKFWVNLMAACAFLYALLNMLETFGGVS